MGHRREAGLAFGIARLIRRRPLSRRRRVGIAPRQSATWCDWSARDWPTTTSPRGFSSHRAPCKPTAPTSTPSSASPRASSSSKKRPATPERRRDAAEGSLNKGENSPVNLPPHGGCSHAGNAQLSMISSTVAPEDAGGAQTGAAEPGYGSEDEKQTCVNLRGRQPSNALSWESRGMRGRDWRRVG